MGGTHATDRNLIAGNGNYGIELMGDGFNVVRGNYVGLNASGIEARPNALGGILIRSSNNDIGGTTGFEDCAPCNVISGNGAAGISVSEDNNVIHGNFIGTNAAGGGDVPNLGDGIVVGGPGLTTSGTVIGNKLPGLARNVISGNDGDGISRRWPGHDDDDDRRKQHRRDRPRPLRVQRRRRDSRRRRRHHDHRIRT